MNRDHLISSEEANNTSRWYAINTNPKQEDRAASNLTAWGVETFSPRIRECRYNQFTGKPTYITKPLFPRYIFARFDASRLLHKICFTRGVHSVVSFDGGPASVDDEIIFFIQSQVKEDGYVRIGDEFKPGDVVMIQSGPLRSLIGIFEREVKDTDRVMILLASVSYQGRLVVERERLKRVNRPRCTA